MCAMRRIVRTASMRARLAAGCSRRSGGRGSVGYTFCLSLRCLEPGIATPELRDGGGVAIGGAPAGVVARSRVWKLSPPSLPDRAARGACAVAARSSKSGSSPPPATPACSAPAVAGGATCEKKPPAEDAGAVAVKWGEVWRRWRCWTLGSVRPRPSLPSILGGQLVAEARVPPAPLVVVPRGVVKRRRGRGSR